MSVASLTWADTASSSNADSDIMTFDEPMLMASSEKSPLTVCVNNVWSSLYYDSSSYVTIPANATMIAWTSQPNSLGDYQILKMQVDDVDLSRFDNLRVRLKGANDVWFDDDFYSHDGRDGFYYFSAYSNESTIHFNLLPGSSFRIKVTSNFPSMGLSVVCSGIYDSNDNPFKMSAVKISSVSMFPFGYVLHSGEFYTYFFQSGGILKKGFEYTFQFYLSGVNCNADLRTVSSPDIIAKGKRSGNFVTFTFTPTRNMRTDELYFYVHKLGNITDMYPFYYVSSSSTYIPASDTGQQGQVTAANTTVIKNVVTNISNTVSNISNQITNTTNTITNTITNTTNQIKEAVNQSANQISQTVTNTSNQIKDSVNQSAEKISQTVTNKVNEVNGTINSVGQKTQEKIDDTKKAVVDKLEDTKTGIITGIIDGLKSLFIPSDDFFKTWFDDMYSFFDDRLGFLMLPVDLLVNLIDMVVSADSSNAGIPFPEIQWEGTVLIPAQTVKIEIFSTEFGKELQDKLYFVGNVIMIGALLSLMHRKIEEVLRS